MKKQKAAAADTPGSGRVAGAGDAGEIAGVARECVASEAQGPRPGLPPPRQPAPEGPRPGQAPASLQKGRGDEGNSAERKNRGGSFASLFSPVVGEADDLDPLHKEAADAAEDELMEKVC